MALRRIQHHVMKYMGTLADMKASGTRVICSCSKCHAWSEVDLDAMILLLGEDGSLWDRSPPCENGDCPELCKFLASGGSVMKPLRSWWAFSLDDLPPRAWMGGWTGAAHPPRAQESSRSPARSST
jgi:hypothetical protein